MAVDLTAGCEGLAALGDATRRWIWHLLGIIVKIQPLKELRDMPLDCYVGVDADAAEIGDRLWCGDDVDDAAAAWLTGVLPIDVR